LTLHREAALRDQPEGVGRSRKDVELLCGRPRHQTDHPTAIDRSGVEEDSERSLTMYQNTDMTLKGVSLRPRAAGWSRQRAGKEEDND
jgi:hypothetical protein